MPKCLVTGASGFIGSRLCRYLVDSGWHVVAFVVPDAPLDQLNPIVNKIQVEKVPADVLAFIDLFNKENFDLVFHLASVFLSEHRPEHISQMIGANLTFGCHVLEAMVTAGCRYFVNTGTSWQHYQNEDYNPVNLYAATKQAFEDLARYYVEAKGLRMITLKLFDTYGEGDPRPKLYNLLEKIALSGEHLKMSPGEQMVDLVHVDRVCETFLVAAERLIKGGVEKHETYGITSGNPRTLKQVVADYEIEHAVKLSIDWGGRCYRDREVMRTWDRFSTLSVSE